LQAAVILALAFAMAGLYYVLPTRAVYLPRLTLFSALGFLLGVGNSLALRRGDNAPATEAGGTIRFPATVAVIFSLVCFNFFLLAAPLSALVPGCFQEAPPWSPSSLLVRHSASVSTGENLVFVGLRHVLAWLVGDSLLINNIVSMLLCSVGLGFLAGGFRLFAGPYVAALGLAMAMTDRWILATAFAGNLPSTLVTVCGLTFFALAWIAVLRRREQPLLCPQVFLLVMSTCLLAMYSYAAVRVPFVLSLVSILGASLLSYGGSRGRRIGAVGVTILAPIVLSVVIVLVGGYRGDIPQFKKDLFVQWPPELIRPHPGPAGLVGFSPIDSGDVAIWLQVARPVNGENFAVVWRRTPGEIFRALIAHISNVLRMPPELFCISPYIFFLAAAALLRVPALPSHMRLAVALVALWSAIWVAAYLLVPDASAYRRGIPFSAVFSLIGGYAFAARRRVRGAALLPVALGGLLAVARFPHELVVSNGSTVRTTMSTVCNNALAIRALLTHNLGAELRERMHYLVIPWREPGEEISCLRSAVASNEWKRRIPSTLMVKAAQGQLKEEISKLPLSAVAIVYCSAETTRDRDVATLCEGAASGAAVRASIAVPDNSASKWVVVERGPADVRRAGRP
jgi:hypothetical protein